MSSTPTDFQTIFEAVPDGLVVHDPETGDILHCNERYCRQTGYSRDELRHLGVSDLTAPDWTASPSALERIQGVAPDEEVTFEWRNQTEDGAVYPVEVSLTVVELDGSERVLATVTDITERKSQERELERKTRAMDKAPIGITLSDPATEGNPIVYANEGFEQLTGYATSTVLGRNCRFLQGEATSPERIAEIRAAIDAEEQVTTELRNYRKDGTEFWSRLTIAPVHDDEGEVVNFVGFQEDVTDRKRAVDAVRQAEAMEAALDGMAVLAPDGTLEYVNEAYAEIHGYPKPGALVGDSWERVYEDAEVTRLRTEVIPRLKTAGRWRGDARGVRADGTTFPQEMSLSRLEDGRMICVVRDNTDRKERERRLARFEKAVEQTGHAIMLVDTDGTIEYVNQAFERITGYDAATVVGKTPNVMNSGEHEQAFFADMWSTILSGDVWQSKIINQRDDGSLMHLNHTIAPVTDGDDDVEEFVAVFSDVTERELEGQQLQVLSRVLRHNLRNTLTVMIGYAESILSAADDESLTTEAASIRDTGNELLHVSEQARKIQRIIRDATERESQVNVCDRVRALASEFEAAVDDVTITMATPDDCDVVAHSSVSVAIGEVLENAIEHNDSTTPRIGVDIAVDTGHDTRRWATVEIRDNGPGIPEHEQRTLQAGEETPLMHGSGLGLWLIHWIVRQLGGKVEISENDPRGTVVTLAVPCDDA